MAGLETGSRNVTSRRPVGQLGDEVPVGIVEDVLARLLQVPADAADLAAVVGATSAGFPRGRCFCITP